MKDKCSEFIKQISAISANYSKADYVKEIKRTLLSLIYPPRCPHCGQMVWHEGEWCASCFESEYALYKIKQTERNQLQHIYVLSHYDNGVKELIRDVKFNKKPERSCWLAPFLMSFTFSLTANMLNDNSEFNLRDSTAFNIYKGNGSVVGSSNSRNICAYIDTIDYIVPIPVSSQKKIERGYNQVDIIFKDWAHSLKEYKPSIQWLDCLEKENSTKKMYALGRVERKANIEKAFSLTSHVMHSGVLKGKRILLVDDIYTTGATLEAAAKVLVRFGQCERVDGLAITGGHSN